MTNCTNLNILGTDYLTVIAISGTASMLYESTTAVTFTATVKNTGTAASIFNAKTITFYVGGPNTEIHTVGLDVINPGATTDIVMTKVWSTWPVGTYSICAKTSDESY